MSRHFCVWLMKPATKDTPAEYCGESVGWKMERDDDGNLVRKYQTLCGKHLRRVEEIKQMRQHAIVSRTCMHIIPNSEPLQFCGKPATHQAEDIDELYFSCEEHKISVSEPIQES